MSKHRTKIFHAEDLLGERWQPVVGFEGFYAVSNLGRVKGIPRKVPRPHPPSGRVLVHNLQARIMKLDTWHGYCAVRLCAEGVETRHQVHALVMAAFVGPRPRGKMILHWNGNGLDNNLENLRYGTNTENRADARRHGTLAVGSRCGAAKLDEHLVAVLRALPRTTFVSSHLAEMIGVNKATVDGARRKGKVWKDVTMVVSERDALEFLTSNYGPYR